ncbi:MAG: plasmid replication DNA-binding protein [Acinetobacter amyesii]|uniref:plasmid replication DNA-binding protein n=1 Tax=Acinetobacter amyesii TaxID=2942470 RepID=UPI003D08839C
MAKLSLSEVSNRFNVSRSTLYRAIKEGRISRGADGLFDVAEVIRCFGEPIKKNDSIQQPSNNPKDDADLRQLVDFMKKEIESYKDREKRYLDQIDRFQLLLGHKETEDKLSHETLMKQDNETPCDISIKTDQITENKEIKKINFPDETLEKRTNDTYWNSSMKQNETIKKRGLFGRVLNAIISDK